MIYELLDEILDFGYVQGTSTELLKAYVFNEPVAIRKNQIQFQVARHESQNHTLHCRRQTHLI